ncbi:MAG: Cof-type HAD-IIB family hydrolase [Propionibacteriaceae bacterium]|jgi:hydroxymethylpyrimidine pyrophosphatase-like HAD family hydrolase|nr:Cof-type HAD-IIB family hydrolase [Propionibacteriaceae bacterium]
MDIDGTILAPGRPIAAAVVEAIDRARDQGALIVLASGRATFEIDDIVTALGLNDGYIICSNGAVVARLPDRAVVVSHSFDVGDSLKQILAAVPNALIAVEDLGRGYRVSAPFPEGELFGPQILVGREQLLVGRTVRAIIRDPQATVADFVRLASSLHLREVVYSVGYRAWLDLGPGGVTKGSALEELARLLQIQRADILAVGDGRNDLEMIQWAGRGVAMGQAPQEVRDQADHTTGDVQQDGLAEELACWFPV